MTSSEHYELDDIKVIWPKQMVTLHGKKVAWYSEEEFRMTKAARHFGGQLEIDLKKWIAKRSSDPETNND